MLLGLMMSSMLTGMSVLVEHLLCMNKSVWSGKVINLIAFERKHVNELIIKPRVSYCSYA